MRTYSFDHFKADKSEPSTTQASGAEQTPPAEQAKHGVPHSEEGQLHYGRQHARTAELYHQRREERERAERMGVSPPGTSTRPPEVQAEPMGGEAPPVQAREEEKSEDTGHEGLKGLAQQAVSSVLEAAREATRGSPLKSARKLATGAVSGVFRVAREVSARAGKMGSDKPKAEKKSGKKEPGKKR
jgi:hypothetical protein